MSRVKRVLIRKSINTKEWFGWNSERSWKTCPLCCLKNADELSFDPHLVHRKTVQKWGWRDTGTRGLRRKAKCSRRVHSSFMTSLWGRAVFGNYSSPQCFQYQHQEPGINQWLETLIDIDIDILDPHSRLPCYVFCICLLRYQKYKSVELGDQLKGPHFWVTI